MKELGACVSPKQEVWDDYCQKYQPNLIGSPRPVFKTAELRSNFPGDVVQCDFPLSRWRVEDLETVI